MNIVQVQGELRSEFGKSFSKKERSNGIIPSVLYGGSETLHFSIDPTSLNNLVYTPDFNIAEVHLDGKVYKTILKAVQYHPLTEKILHVDFLQLIDNKPIRVEIPLRFKGASPGVKLGGKLLQQVRKIKVKTTPEYLVGELSADISSLDLGQSLRIRDVEVPTGIQIMANGSIPVALIEIPRSLKSASAAAAKEGKK